MPKIDLDTVPEVRTTVYPAPYAGELEGRTVRRLGPAAGLTDYGVAHVRLEPGAWSSQRHWHESEDEFAVMVSGEAVLIDDAGRTPLRAGDCIAFPKNDGNGHHIVNEGDGPCVFVVVGRPSAGMIHYPDIDLMTDLENRRFVRKDGRAF